MKNTKDRILAQGVDLLSASGFAQVTVGLLAQRTGMSKSGLFAHFGSKEEVQLGLMEETVRMSSICFVEPAMQNDPGLGRLRALVYGWLGWTGKAGLSGGALSRQVFSNSTMLPNPIPYGNDCFRGRSNGESCWSPRPRKQLLRENSRLTLISISSSGSSAAST